VQAPCSNERAFELSEFQPGIIKQTCNMRIQEPKIRIVDHDHIAVITWFDTHIIVHRSKRSNLRKKNFQAQDSTSCSHKKTLQSNVSWLQRAFSSSVTLKERLSRDRSSLVSKSESEMFLKDLPMRQKLVKSSFLDWLLILL
jgi:hypothetical protein